MFVNQNIALATPHEVSFFYCILSSLQNSCQTLRVSTFKLEPKTRVFWVYPNLSDYLGSQHGDIQYFYYGYYYHYSTCGQYETWQVPFFFFFGLILFFFSFNRRKFPLKVFPGAPPESELLPFTQCLETSNTIIGSHVSNEKCQGIRRKNI